MFLSKKYFLITIFSLFLVFCFVSVSAEEDLIDPNIPDSWYEAPKTASEMGIEEFYQSSMLDERVKEGELPPVEERLPDDPPVVEPYNNQVGKHGGTANVFTPELDAPWVSDGVAFFDYSHLGRAVPDGSKIVPYLAKDWEYSDDYQSLTLYLREGLKWSDGHPYTADDWVFWWEHVVTNEDIYASPPDPYENVEKINDYEVKFHFDKPSPTFHNEFHVWDYEAFDYPKHFLKQFHPDFIGEEKAEKMAEEEDFDDWVTLFEAVRDIRGNPDRFEWGMRPVLRQYVVVERTETTLKYERNPYSPFVDTEGNQLPYVDTVIENYAQDREMITAKAVTGDVTFAVQSLEPQEIPMYKQYEEQEGFKTYIWQSGRGAEFMIQPNHCHEDPVIREVFHDVRFRQALSYLIDRETINRKIYLDRATPRQNTQLPTSRYFDPEFAESYAEFDPEKAKKLLDEIGMVDKTGNGYRDRPDGESFSPTLVYWDMDGPVTEVLELISNQWREVGLDIDIKMISRGLWAERKGIDDWDLTIEINDRANDLIFPAAMGMNYAPDGTGGNHTPWMGWTQWSGSDGKEGKEPPEHIMELVDLAEKVKHSVDEEERLNAGKKLLQAQADNLWSIGTVGMGPVPVIVADEFKNVPRSGIFDPTLKRFDPYYRVQFWLDE